MKPTIRIKTHKNTTLSKSFFGGLPEVPTNFDWPLWNATSYYLDEIEYAEKSFRAYSTGIWTRAIEENKKWLQAPLFPLMFLGQIHLDEVPRFGQFPNLPSSGILYFFWAAHLSPPGWRASSKGSCRVIYIKETSDLRTLLFPEEMVRKFGDDFITQANHPRCSLSFEPSWALTNYLDKVNAIDYDDDRAIDRLVAESRQSELLDNISDSFPEFNKSTLVNKDFSSQGESIHMLLGSPIEIQNPMEEMCQLCFHGFDEIDHNINFDAEVAHLRAGVKDWQLLLQLDCDDNLDWLWGDAGMLYFWIRKQDLEEQNFSNVWCEMQCF